MVKNNANETPTYKINETKFVIHKGSIVYSEYHIRNEKKYIYRDSYRLNYSFRTPFSFSIV